MASMLAAWTWIKTNTLLILGVVVAILWGVIQGLRRDKAKTQADLAKGEADALKRAIAAQESARQETSEKIEEGNDKRKNSDFGDIP